jgi:glycosyltransferase involved in cell wall biosynthesis
MERPPHDPLPDERGRRVLVLAAEFPPLGGGGVIRVTKLVKYLSRLGWDVDVACSDEPLADAVDPTLLEEVPAAVTIHRVRAPLHGVSRAATAGAKRRLPRQALWFRALFRARQAARAMLAIPDRWLPWALTVGRTQQWRQARPSIIIGSGPPHSVHVAGVMLSRRWRVPYVADLRDEWTLRPLTRSRLPWRRAVERRLERWCLGRAAAVVVVSDESRERYEARDPALKGRIVVIPNGYDPEDFAAPSAASSAREKLTVGYSGSFQVGTDVRPLFAGIGAVVAAGFDGRAVRFEMVGPFLPEEVELARTSVASHALSIGSFVPHRQSLELMAGWDVLCVVATDGRASLAGKLYECLALRRPIVVVAPEGPATRLVTELGAGTVGDPRDADGIRSAILGALSMAGPDFEGPSAAALAPYDRRLQANRWSQLLDRLIAQSAPG